VSAAFVALEDDTATVWQVFEDVRRGVLVDAHDVRAADCIALKSLILASACSPDDRGG